MVPSEWSWEVCLVEVKIAVKEKSIISEIERVRPLNLFVDAPHDEANVLQGMLQRLFSLVMLFTNIADTSKVFNSSISGNKNAVNSKAVQAKSGIRLGEMFSILSGDVCTKCLCKYTLGICRVSLGPKPTVGALEAAWVIKIMLFENVLVQPYSKVVVIGGLLNFRLGPELFDFSLVLSPFPEGVDGCVIANLSGVLFKTELKAH